MEKTATPGYNYLLGFLVELNNFQKCYNPDHKILRLFDV